MSTTKSKTFTPNRNSDRQNSNYKGNNYDPNYRKNNDRDNDRDKEVEDKNKTVDKKETTEKNKNSNVSNTRYVPSNEQVNLSKMMDKQDKFANIPDELILQVQDITNKNKDRVMIALYDNNNDTEKAVNYLLEASSNEGADEWVTSGKKKKIKEAEPKENTEKSLSPNSKPNKFNKKEKFKNDNFKRKSFKRPDKNSNDIEDKEFGSAFVSNEDKGDKNWENNFDGDEFENLDNFQKSKFDDPKDRPGYNPEINTGYDPNRSKTEKSTDELDLHSDDNFNDGKQFGRFKSDKRGGYNSRGGFSDRGRGRGGPSNRGRFNNRGGFDNFDDRNKNVRKYDRFEKSDGNGRNYKNNNYGNNNFSRGNYKGNNSNYRGRRNDHFNNRRYERDEPKESTFENNWGDNTETGIWNDNDQNQIENEGGNWDCWNDNNKNNNWTASSPTKTNNSGDNLNGNLENQESLKESPNKNLNAGDSWGKSPRIGDATGDLVGHGNAQQICPETERSNGPAFINKFSKQMQDQAERKAQTNQKMAENDLMINHRDGDDNGGMGKMFRNEMSGNNYHRNNQEKAGKFPPGFNRGKGLGILTNQQPINQSQMNTLQQYRQQKMQLHQENLAINNRSKTISNQQLSPNQSLENFSNIQKSQIQQPFGRQMVGQFGNFMQSNQHSNMQHSTRHSNNNINHQTSPSNHQHQMIEQNQDRQRFRDQMDTFNRQAPINQQHQRESQRKHLETTKKYYKKDSTEQNILRDIRNDKLDLTEEKEDVKKPNVVDTLVNQMSAQKIDVSNQEDGMPSPNSSSSNNILLQQSQKQSMMTNLNNSNAKQQISRPTSRSGQNVSGSRPTSVPNNINIGKVQSNLNFSQGHHGHSSGHGHHPTHSNQNSISQTTPNQNQPQNQNNTHPQTNHQHSNSHTSSHGSSHQPNQNQHSQSTTSAQNSQTNHHSNNHSLTFAVGSNIPQTFMNDYNKSHQQQRGGIFIDNNKRHEESKQMYPQQMYYHPQHFNNPFTNNLANNYGYNSHYQNTLMFNNQSQNWNNPSQTVQQNENTIKQLAYKGQNYSQQIAVSASSQSVNQNNMNVQSHGSVISQNNSQTHQNQQNVQHQQSTNQVQNLTQQVQHSNAQIGPNSHAYYINQPQNMIHNQNQNHHGIVSPNVNRMYASDLTALNGGVGAHGVR